MSLKLLPIPTCNLLIFMLVRANIGGGGACAPSAPMNVNPLSGSHTYEA